MFDVFLELFFYTLVGLALVYWLPVFQMNGFNKLTVSALYLLKVVSGTFIYYIYAFHFSGGDIFMYFLDGVALAEVFEKDFEMGMHYWLGNVPADSIKNILPFSSAWDCIDCRSIIRLNALTYFLSGSNYFINAAIINVIFLHSCITLYNKTTNYFTSQKRLVLIAIFFIPSVSLWGSSFLKDALFLMSLNYVIGSILSCYYEKKNSDYLWLLISVVVMVWIKPLSMVLLIPGSFYLLVNAFISKRHQQKIVVIAVIMGLVVLQISALLPTSYDLLEQLSNYQQKHIQLAADGWSSESLFWVPQITNNSLVFLVDLFIGFFNGIMQPIHPHGKLLNSIQLLENIALLASFIYLAYIRIKLKSPFSPMAIFMFITAIFSLSILGLSVPVAGALVRYRIFALPLLYLGLLKK